MRKKAETQTHKLGSRPSQGEKRNSKRMVTLTPVYNIKPRLSSATDFQRELSGQGNAEREPSLIAKRVWASVEKKTEQVVSEMIVEALVGIPIKIRHG